MAEVITTLPPGGGPQFRPPEPIKAAHDVSGFSCGREELDTWLKRRALANKSSNASRTYVVALGPRVVGYYTLSAGSVNRDQLPTAALRRNMPDKVPTVVLGRLATDKNFEKRGIGTGILQEAITRMLAASTEIGVRGLLVHVLDDEAAAFYRRYPFVECHIGNRTLLLPVETARQAILAKRAAVSE